MTNGRSAHFARVIFVILALSPTFLCAQHVPAERDITGWQKVRFGMSTADVLKTYPAGELNEMLCSENRKSILLAGQSCKQVMLPNAPAAGLTWNATLQFSEREELMRVQLTLQDTSRATPDTFMSVLGSLNESYGARAVDVRLANQQIWLEECRKVVSRLKAEEPVRPIEFWLAKDQRLAYIERKSGRVELNYEIRAACDGAPAILSRLPNDRPSIELEYSRRTVTTTEGL